MITIGTVITDGTVRGGGTTHSTGTRVIMTLIGVGTIITTPFTILVSIQGGILRMAAITTIITPHARNIADLRQAIVVIAPAQSVARARQPLIARARIAVMYQPTALLFPLTEVRAGPLLQPLLQPEMNVHSAL